MPNSRLRLVLLVNSVSSAITGIVLLALAELLEPFVGLSAISLRVVGAGLLPFAGFVAWLARESAPRARLVTLVSAADFCWVAASVAVVLLGPVTTLGAVAVVAIALAVELFGTLQLYYSRRRERALVAI